jgi:hypothetical protein
MKFFAAIFQHVAVPCHASPSNFSVPWPARQGTATSRIQLFYHFYKSELDFGVSEM